MAKSKKVNLINTPLIIVFVLVGYFGITSCNDMYCGIGAFALIIFLFFTYLIFILVDATVSDFGEKRKWRIVLTNSLRVVVMTLIALFFYYLSTH